MWWICRLYRGQPSAVTCTLLFPAKTSSRAQVRRSRTSSKRLPWRRGSKNQVTKIFEQTLSCVVAAPIATMPTLVDLCRPKGNMWLECAAMVWNGRRALLGDVEVHFSQELLRCFESMTYMYCDYLPPKETCTRNNEKKHL